MMGCLHARRLGFFSFLLPLSVYGAIVSPVIGRDARNWIPQIRSRATAVRFVGSLNACRGGQSDTDTSEVEEQASLTYLRNCGAPTDGKSATIEWLERDDGDGMVPVTEDFKQIVERFVSSQHGGRVIHLQLSQLLKSRGYARCLVI